MGLNDAEYDAAILDTFSSLLAYADACGHQPERWHFSSQAFHTLQAKGGNSIARPGEDEPKTCMGLPFGVTAPFGETVTLFCKGGVEISEDANERHAAALVGKSPPLPKVKFRHRSAD